MGEDGVADRRRGPIRVDGRRADADSIERLARIGDIIGIAFQVSDDIIDISSATGDSGKTPGTDLREGVHTLPVLYALRGEDPSSQRLRALLLDAEGNPRALTDDAEVTEALERLNASPGMARAHAKLQSYADEALAELARLPETPASGALSSLVRYTIDRTG